MTAAVDPLVTGVVVAVVSALAISAFGWFTGRRSVALNELDTALEFFKGEAEEARKLRRENRALDEKIDQLEAELVTVRSVAVRLEREKNELKDRVTRLEEQLGGDGVT